MMLLLLACSEPAPTPEDANGCNGHDVLCERAVDEVVFLRSHNSHASEERGYSVFSMNHYEAIPTQLADGVRSLNIDIYEEDGVLLACHGFCELGQQPLLEVLDELGTFLAENPREVVLLDVQDEAPEGAVQTAIADHGLPLADIAPGAWPTLGALVDEGTTLVYLHPHGDYVYSTGWQYDTPEDLDCATTPFEGGLYEVTHVLTNPLANPDNATLINGRDVMLEHIDRCIDEVGLPNQVSVDFYSIGDTVAVVDELNGVTTAPE